MGHLLFNRSSLGIEIDDMECRIILSNNRPKNSVSMRRSDIDKLLIRSLMTSVEQQIEICWQSNQSGRSSLHISVGLTAHAINDNQKVLVHIHNIVSMSDLLIPTSDRSDSLIVAS